MSVSRAVLQSRFALSRAFASSRATSSILRLTSTAAPQRQFTLSARFQGEVIQTPATGPEAPLTATRDEGVRNGIVITKLSRHTTPNEIQQLLRDAGVEVKRLHCRIDRFTFENARSVFIELGNEEQVQKAVKALNGLKMGKDARTLAVSPLADTFNWEADDRMKQRFFLYGETAASEAIRPLLEGRRYTFHVEKPGWIFNKVADKTMNDQRQEVLDRALEPFNVEARGDMNKIFIHKGASMWFLTCVDFATKEDAQRAVNALHNSVIQGKRVELRPFSVFTAKRVEQIGKVDKGVLAQLQEAGLLKTEIGKSPS